ncbi:MAG: aminotransferase class IV [Planctomycetota bacterium]
MRELCNVDGRVQPLERATVPVMDRGFLFGDSVYEVVRTHDGVPFAWPEHLARLKSSAAALRLDIGLPDDVLARRVRDTIEAARSDDGGEAYVRVIVTRGVGTAPSIDIGCAPGPSRCLILVRALPAAPIRPAKLALVERLRVDRRALDPAIKSGNYLNNVLALAEAKARGADDCIMLNAAGHVTEASTANLFVVTAGIVRTPPLSAGILAGVTRALVLDVCRLENIDALEQDLTPVDLRSADQMFLSSTLRDVWPVAELDGHAVGGGKGLGETTTARIADAMRDRISHAMRDVYAPAWEAATAPPP